MESKNSTICNTEKHISNFYKHFAECKECTTKRVSKHYYDNKSKISNQRTILMEKQDEWLQEQKDKNIHFKELVGKYDEIGNRLKERAVGFNSAIALFVSPNWFVKTVLAKITIPSIINSFFKTITKSFDFR